MAYRVENWQWKRFREFFGTVIQLPSLETNMINTRREMWSRSKCAENRSVREITKNVGAVQKLSYDFLVYITH